MPSQATRQSALRDLVRRYMTNGTHPEGPVPLMADALAERFGTPTAAMRTVLKGLAGETGRGVHQISGDHYEYRPVERTRKATDTHVKVKVATYMQGTKPGSLHMVQDVARACKTLPASTSGALKALAKDSYLYIVKTGYGTYSYRPPGTPGVGEENGTPQPAPTPADMPRTGRGSVPSITVADDADDAAERTFAVGDEEEHGTFVVNLPGPPRQPKTLLVREPYGPEYTMGPGEVPEGWLLIVHTTRQGVRLAEDHEGRLFKVISIEENQ
jgi:hypothetical protein